MKKLYSILTVAVSGAILISCGGGGAGKGGQLGNIPALYEKFNKAEADIKASVEGKDMAAITKIYAEWQTKEKQLELDVAAEMAKLAGKEIPVKYSPELQKSFELFYDAKATFDDAKGNTRYKLTITAKNDYEIPEKEEATRIPYLLVDKDGAVIDRGAMELTEMKTPGWGKTRKARSIAKGEVVKEWGGYMDVKKEPAKWAGFAAVQFISKAEYDTLK